MTGGDHQRPPSAARHIFNVLLAATLGALVGAAAAHIPLAGRLSALEANDRAYERTLSEIQRDVRDMRAELRELGGAVLRR